MIKNILKTSFRAFFKDKSFSILNVIGLSIGICSCLLILLWIVDELTYDHFFPKYKHIYQVRINSRSNGGVNTKKSVCMPLYEALKTEDPGIVNTAFTNFTYGHSITVGEKILQKEVLAVSTEFLDIFELTFVQGSAATAFPDPYSIILNESVARDIFGDIDPMNKYVKLDNNKEVKVTGIYKDLPENSSFWFHALIPIKFYEETEKLMTKSQDDWSAFDFQIYVETRPGISEDDVNGRIRNILKGKFAEGEKYEIFLHPMDRWHLYGKFQNGKEDGGKIEYVRLFSAIAILTLLIACVNYMNLATARSERRAKEVGIRKCIGSGRGELIMQFFTESFLITLLSFIVGILLVQLFLPYYNNLVHKKLSIDFASMNFWLIAVLFLSVVSFFSGLYPALYFSAFEPIKVLKGTFNVGKRAGLPRTISVTAQYLFSIFLFIGMIVIYQQIQFVKNRHLGYDKDHLLLIPTNDEMIANYNSIKNELITSGIAVSVTKSNQPVTGAVWTESVSWSGKIDNEKVEFTSVSADYDYARTMGIKVVEGRDFSQDFSTDSTAILVNKKAIAAMGLSNPLGQKIRIRDREWTIIGVLDDVLMGSPYEPIDPLFIAMMGDWNNYIGVRLSKTEDLSANVAKLEAIFKKHNPSNILEELFADEEFNYKFRDIELSGTLAKLFAVLALVITCLGVFGLAAYVAERRTKEIAIRKILGAQNQSLLFLLCSNFAKIILVSSAISIPISLVFMNNFLNKYAYRVSIQWWTLPLVFAFVLAITVLIVCIQVMKTVNANPIYSLKSE